MIGSTFEFCLYLMHERMPIQFILSLTYPLGHFRVFIFFNIHIFLTTASYTRGSSQNYFNLVEMNILLFFPFAMIFAFDCSQFPGRFFFNRSWFRDRIFTGIGIFLFCARSENSDISISRYENSEKILSTKSQKLRDRDRDRDKNIPKKILGGKAQYSRDWDLFFRDNNNNIPKTRRSTFTGSKRKNR